MTNYSAMAKRIKACKTLEEIRRCEKSLDRLYNARIFSASEFMHLDNVVMQQYIKIEG